MKQYLFGVWTRSGEKVAQYFVTDSTVKQSMMDELADGYNVTVWAVDLKRGDVPDYVRQSFDNRAVRTK